MIPMVPGELFVSLLSFKSLLGFHSKSVPFDPYIHLHGVYRNVREFYFIDASLPLDWTKKIRS